MKPCSACNGSGENAGAVEFAGSGKEVNVLIASDAGAALWAYQEGAPCWLCRGKRAIMCGDCDGRGFGAGDDENSMYNGD